MSPRPPTLKFLGGLCTHRETTENPTRTSKFTPTHSCVVARRGSQQLRPIPTTTLMALRAGEPPPPTARYSPGRRGSGCPCPQGLRGRRAAAAVAAFPLRSANQVPWAQSHQRALRTQGTHVPSRTGDGIPTPQPGARTTSPRRGEAVASGRAGLPTSFTRPSQGAAESAGMTRHSQDGAFSTFRVGPLPAAPWSRARRLPAKAPVNQRDGWRVPGAVQGIYFSEHHESQENQSPSAIPVLRGNSELGSR